MSDDRYQFQPRYIQVYRWLRYMPFYYCLGLFNVARWWLFDRTIPTYLPRDCVRKDCVILGTKRPIPLFESRWAMAAHIMQIHRSLASGKMKHYWKLQELLDDIRSRQ